MPGELYKATYEASKTSYPWVFPKIFHKRKYLFLRIFFQNVILLGLSWWLSGKESASQLRGCGFDPWSRKKPQVPNTARQAASLPGDISRGRRSSMTQPKTRPDSPVPSLQGPCDRSLKSGTQRFLPQLEMRPSSNAPSPVESREAPPTSSFPGFSEPP